MGVTNTRTVDGRDKIYISNKPDESLHTVFSGTGDSGGLIALSLQANETESFVELSYSETVHIKEGRIKSENAPFGSYLDVDIRHPITGAVLAIFCKHIPLLGTDGGWLELNTENSSEIPKGLKVRLTLYNSSGLGTFDPPAAFRLVGIIEMYRLNQIF